MKRLSIPKLVLLAAVTLVVAACMDLDVANPNEPDRDRALKSGQDVEALIAGTFRTWWNLQQGNAPGPALASAADEVTAGAANYGHGDMSAEPRIPVVNIADYRWGYFVDDPWFLMNRAIAAVRDALQSIEGGVDIGEGGSANVRAQAFAKFMQGLAHGHIAMLYDQGFIVDETVEDLDAVEPQPYDEVMAAARAYLAEARALASQGSFSIPSSWMAAEYSSADLIRLTHSYEARFMAQVARTPEERAAVNWAEVLSHINQGVTEDFGVNLDGRGGIWASNLKESLSGIGDRIDLANIGRADQSGGWQAYEQTPGPEKTPFLIDTDDRRITGGSPTEAGLYVEYDPDWGTAPERGTWFGSQYASLLWRDMAETDLGFAPDLTVEEMEFLAAEAHIRLGNPAQALPVINRARVEVAGLPPATVEGVSGPRCVPRTAAGACGDLLYTLAYEKQMQLFLLSQGSHYYDDRGWGLLRTGTALHLPMPAKELQTLGMPVYTFGGVGGDAAAP